MSNREILAELKICYEFLTDINDNQYQQVKYNDRLEINKMINSLADIYDDIRTNMSDDECIVKVNGCTYLIGHTISEDYNIPSEDTYITCGDLGHCWYATEIGKSYNDDYVCAIENGLMSALDEICFLSKEVGKDFDYYDKTRDLTGLNNSVALDFLDRVGGDNNDKE